MMELWPPLSVVRERLGLVKDAPMPDTLDSGPPPASESMESSEPLPALIGLRIQQISRARSLRADWPQPGLIIRDGSVGVCLNRQLDANGHLWSGWTTAPDTEYAANRDVLLDEDDEPFDPYAAVIQTWNPVVIRVQRPIEVLAQIGPSRLETVRDVAKEGAALALPPSAAPHAFLRRTQTGRVVLTGPPLAGTEDPRAAYQKLYADLAGSLSAAARSKSAAQRVSGSLLGKPAAFVEWILGHGLQWAGIATTVAGVMVAALMLLNQAEAPGNAPSQIARNDATSPRTPDLPDAGPNKQAGAPVSTNTKPSTSVEATQLEKLEPVKKKPPKLGTAPVTELAKGETEGTPTVDKTELASLFLTPLKDQSFTIAMRGAGPDSHSFHLYRLRLRAATTQEAALELLDILGLKVTRVDEAKRTIDIAAEKKVITPELESRLKASALFAEAKRK